MEVITLRAVTQENWHEALRLEVSPDQQRYVAGYAPIVALALAKAYVHLGNATWDPYAIYADTTMVGFVALSYIPDSTEEFWIFHFFIDVHYQCRGYGTAALQRLIELVRYDHPRCQSLRLVVHPENHRARQFYAAAGFRPTGAERWGEPVFHLMMPGE